MNVGSVDTRLRKKFSALMFLRHGAQGTFFPFFAILLMEDLAIGEVGILFAVGALLIFFFQPVLGWIADRYDRSVVFSTLCAVNSVLAVALVSMSWAVFVIVPILYLFSKATSVILDSIVVGEMPTTFGAIRMFGSLGFGLGVVLGGGAYQIWGIEAIAPLYFTGYMAAALLARTLPQKRRKLMTSAVSAPTIFSAGADLRLFPASFLFLSVLLAIAVLVIRSSESFYSVGLLEQGSNGLFIGVAWLAFVLPEALFLLMTDRFISRWGAPLCAVVGTVLLSLRFGILAIYTDPWVWSLSQPLGALAFAFWYVGAVRAIKDQSPTGHVSLGQSLFAAVSALVGEIGGNAIGGFLIASVGFASYYGFGTALLAFSAVSLAGMFWLPRSVRQKS